MMKKLMSRYTKLTIQLFVVCLMTCLPAVADAVDDIPVVVFRSDDIRGSWALNYAPTEFGGKTPLQYGIEKKIPVTWGTIVIKIGAKDYLSAAQLTEYLSGAGGEIASHSVTHVAMPTNAAYIKELADSKRILKEMFPLYFQDGFIQPGYWLGAGNLNTWPNLFSDIGTALRANYKWSGDYLYTAKKMGGVHYPYGMCTDYCIDYSATVTADSVRTVLNEITKVPGMVFIFTCHGIQPSAGTSTDVRADVMQAFMDTAADLRDQGKIHFLSQADAVEHAFPANINCIPNGGFESGLYWWNVYNGVTTAAGGNNGSERALDLNSVSASQPAVNMTISIGPGKYALDWYQRVENITNSPLEVKVQQYIAGRQMPFDPLANPGYKNTAVGVWQPRKALLVVNDGFPKTILTLQSTSNAHYLADDVSLRLLNLDPAQSPTDAAASAKPQSCVVSWRSPSSSVVTSIIIRVGTNTHPLTPTDGAFFAQINPVNGSLQSVSAPIKWSSYPGGAFFSVFAMNGSAFAPPDIAFASEPQDISYMKNKPENASVVTNGAVVSAAFADYFYIENRNRTSGIRIEKNAHGLAKGMTAGITGSVKTDANGERYISATNAIRDGYDGVFPLGVANKWLGGSSMTGGKGLSNIGLLVKTWGAVVSAGNPFVMSDGSQALVSVTLPPGASSPVTGDRVVVTGVSSCMKNATTGEVSRMIRATEVVPQ